MIRNRRCGFIQLVVALALSLAGGITHAQSTAWVKRITFSGKLGQTRIGMTLVVNSSGTIIGGHYFYARNLKDIPLTTGVQSPAIILSAPEGSQFVLNFKGNGSEDGRPLDFDNSIGLRGKWTKGASSYPVTLQMEGRSEGNPDARWYEDVTSEGDAAFEASVQGFLKAVLAGDRAAASGYIDFPLRVNHSGKSSTIRSKAELSVQWEKIFTRACLAALEKAVPHDMFVRNGQVMLGDGVAWFNSKGVRAINVP